LMPGVYFPVLAFSSVSIAFVFTIFTAYTQFSVEVVIIKTIYFISYDVISKYISPSSRHIILFLLLCVWMFIMPSLGDTFLAYLLPIGSLLLFLLNRIFNLCRYFLELFILLGVAYVGYK
jgi:hypothetical protein